MLPFVIESAFARGLIMGVLMAAPIGAVGVMCVTRAANGAWLRAGAVALGSASVDALFGAIAGLGLTIIAGFIIENQTPLALMGGVIVTGLGLATFLSPLSAEEPELESEKLRRDFASAFMMSIANPATFLGAVGLYAALGSAEPEIARQTAGELVLGVFTGSLAWWTFLTLMTRLFRDRFSPATLKRINKIEGVVIIGLGLAVIALAAITSLT